MEYNSKSKRVYEEMVQDIWKGKYDLKERLPKEEDLAAHYGVTRMTLRKTIEMLVTNGILERISHSGTRICSSIVTPNTPVASDKKYPLVAAFMAEGASSVSLEICRGIRAYVEEANMKMQVLQSYAGMHGAMEELLHLDRNQVAGLVVLSHDREMNDALQQLHEKGMPMVSVEKGIIGNMEIPHVFTDNFTGVYFAVSKMLKKFMRPVYYVGEKVDSYTNKHKFMGYTLAMQEYGFKEIIHDMTYLAPYKDEENMWWSEQGDLILKKAVDDFMSKVAFPISVVTENDYISRVISFKAEEMNLVVGRDVIIWGNDDLPFARTMKCPLSSIRHPRYEMGYEAAKLLDACIRGEKNNALVRIFPSEVIERESSNGTI